MGQLKTSYSVTHITILIICSLIMGTRGQSDYSSYSYDTGGGNSYSSGGGYGYYNGGGNGYSSGGGNGYSTGGGNSYSIGGGNGYSSGGGNGYSTGGGNSYSSGGGNGYSTGGDNSYSSGGGNGYSTVGGNSYSSGGGNGYSTGGSNSYSSGGYDGTPGNYFPGGIGPLPGIPPYDSDSYRYDSGNSDENSRSSSSFIYSSDETTIPTCELADQANDICNGFAECDDGSDEMGCSYNCLNYKDLGITKRQCGSALTYTKTFFPNFIFNIKTDTERFLERFGNIKNCGHSRVVEFLCGILSPECPAASSHRQTQAPCKELCEEIAGVDKCDRMFKGLQLPLRVRVCPFLPTFKVDDDASFCTFVELPKHAASTLPPVPPVMPTCELAQPTDQCNGYSNCPDGSDEINCQYNCIDYTVFVPDCSNWLTYSQTFYPNPGFATLEGAQSAATGFSDIHECYQRSDQRALVLMCGMLAPQCPSTSESGKVQGACRHLCEEIAEVIASSRKRSCARQVNLLNSICPSLPTIPVEGNSDFCVYADHVATTRPPTTIKPITTKLTTTENIVTTTKEVTNLATTKQTTTGIPTRTKLPTSTKMPTTEMRPISTKRSATRMVATSTTIMKDSTIRLIGGNSDNEGTIEILQFNQWGTICSRRWGKKDADVACRHLGYTGAVAPYRSAYFGQGNGPVWLTNVGCKGDEAVLHDCLHTGWNNNNCSHEDDAGVACADQAIASTDTIRLVGGSTEGTVHIYHNNTWGTICDTNWGYGDANVVCKQLGFPGAVASVRDAYYGQGSGPVWIDDVGCLGDESSVTDCIFKGWGNTECNHKDDAGVVCMLPGKVIDIPDKNNVDKAFLTNTTSSSNDNSSGNTLRLSGFYIALSMLLAVIYLFTSFKILELTEAYLM